MWREICFNGCGCMHDGEEERRKGERGKEGRVKERNGLSTVYPWYRPAPPPVFNSCTTLNQSPSFILRSTARSLVVQSRGRQLIGTHLGSFPDYQFDKCSMGMRPASDTKVRSLFWSVVIKY